MKELLTLGLSVVNYSQQQQKLQPQRVGFHVQSLVSQPEANIEDRIIATFFNFNDSTEQKLKANNNNNNNNNITTTTTNIF